MWPSIGDICFGLRILYLLPRLMFAISAIVNTSFLVSNGLFSIVIFNCRTSRLLMFLNPFFCFVFVSKEFYQQPSSLFDNLSSAFLKFVV